MITLQNYFMEPNYDILYETNIDQLFNIFEKSLNNIDNNIILNKILVDFLKENKIEFYKYPSKNKNLKAVRGGWGHNPKSGNLYIAIEYPINVNQDIIDKQSIRSALHEMVHVLNYEKIPNFITNQTGKRFDTINAIVPHTYDLPNVNIDDMIKYLDYITHLREKANFAFTIALSCYFDMNNMSPEEVFNNNFKRINEFNTGQIDNATFNSYMRTQKFDAMELLTMQWAMFHVGQKKYINQIYSILRLSVKYWKRLNKLLGEPYGT